MNTPDDFVAQWQRVRLQIGRLGIQLPLGSYLVTFASSRWGHIWSLLLPPSGVTFGHFCFLFCPPAPLARLPLRMIPPPPAGRSPSAPRSRVCAALLAAPRRGLAAPTALASRLGIRLPASACVLAGLCVQTHLLVFSPARPQWQDSTPSGVTFGHFCFLFCPPLSPVSPYA